MTVLMKTRRYKKSWLIVKHGRMSGFGPLRGPWSLTHTDFIWCVGLYIITEGSIVMCGQVELPCKDVVCAHIMEFIDGLSPATHSRAFGGYLNEEETNKFVRHLPTTRKSLELTSALPISSPPL